MSDELDADVGEGRGGGPAGHDEERGGGRNGVVLTDWGLNCGGEGGEGSVEVAD